MTNLIDKNAAIDAVAFGITYAKAFDKETGEVKELFAQSNYELRKAVDRIKELPSTDAVEVVRCKDCKYWPYKTIPYWDNQIEFKTYQWCASLGLHGGKGFCSKGERRPDAD